MNLITSFALTVAAVAAPREIFAPTSLAQDAKPAATAGSTATGVAKGRVLFDGEKPETKPLAIDPEKAKDCTHGGETLDTRDLSLLIGKENGIANVVVTIEVTDAKVKVPEAPIVLDQKKCAFEPHVMIVPAGATIDFKNSDATGHNVHVFPLKNDGFNQTVGAGSKYTAKFEKADKIQIKCDLHPWMNSWLIVTDSPYTAVTDADGKFSIAGLPPGEWKVTLWHEKLGKTSSTVKVGADGKVDALEFKIGEKKESSRRR